MMSFSQCRAARALVEWPRRKLAEASSVDIAVIEALERDGLVPPEEILASLERALEEAGAIFIPEGPAGGRGVRLRYSSKDVRQIRKWEGEGGVPGDDDV